MATKDSMPAVSSKSTMTPTGEESVTPVSQPSGLGELSASVVTETDRRLEAIQRAQVSWTLLAICWPSMERKPTLGQASSMIKVS